MTQWLIKYEVEGIAGQKEMTINAPSAELAEKAAFLGLKLKWMKEVDNNPRNIRFLSTSPSKKNRR